MNYFLLVLLSLLLTIKDFPKGSTVHCKPPARCTGSFPCYACSSCNYCKYCNSGGACGICTKPKKTQSSSLYAHQKAANVRLSLKKKVHAAHGKLKMADIVGNTSINHV